jgi:hypothetical protein
MRKGILYCPYCLEEALKYAIIDIDGTNIEEGYSCKECGAEFIGIENEEVIRVNRVKKISPSTQVYNRLLKKLDCSRGAPMGRPNIGTKDDAEGKRIYCRYVPLVYDGAYDRGGAYWGYGAPLYVEFTLDRSYVNFYRKE